uniref:Uncharacterized protein n=1 Tax=Caenorhabditis japonica TaxID=281687 RepID=A0A8R1J169_CAEJA
MVFFSKFQQTGFNEISAVTSFGLYVLRENLRGPRRFGRVGAHWLTKYQNAQIIRNPKIKEDFLRAELNRLSIDSITEGMRPRVGSTVSQLTYRYSDDDGIDRVERRRATMGAKDYREQKAATQSASGSSNGSSSRLRQLDVTVTDLYYQDGPCDPLSPNRSTASPRMNPIHELLSHPQSPLAASDNRSQPVFFRATSKNPTSPQPRLNK